MTINATTRSILDQLQSKSLSVSEWNDKISSIPSQDLPLVVRRILELITQESSYYLDFLLSLVLINRDEDRITDLQEIIFSYVEPTALEQEWFTKLWNVFLGWTNSDDLIENFFFFLGQLYQKQPFQYNSKFVQSLLPLQSSVIQFNLMIFLAEHQLHVFENNEILQLFFRVPESSKLNFIPILITFPKRDYISISKAILFSKKLSKEPYVILALLFQVKEFLEQIFDSYGEFIEYIKELHEQKILELLFAEYTKPESISKPWIRKLLLDYLKQNTQLSTYIIESSGEYIADWQEQFRKDFLQLIIDGNNNLKKSLASILSPLWFDEEIILQLFESDNETVLESLFESIILIYQLLSPELKEKFHRLFKKEQKKQKFYGLLLAYNFQVPSFFKEVQQELEDLSNPIHEQLLAGMLVGLGMRWNDIDKEFQVTLKNKIKKMSVAQQQELRKGLELIYGSLDLEAINIVTNLQSYQFQVSLDDVSLD